MERGTSAVKKMVLGCILWGFWGCADQDSVLARDGTDFYSQWVEICREPGPQGEKVSPACQAAMQSLPLGQSLRGAPSSFRDALYEVFWNALYVPLALPENGYMWGDQQGVTPLRFVCFFHPERFPDVCPGSHQAMNLNQLLVNFIVNQTDGFEYVDAKGIYGEYALRGTQRVVLLAPSFWDNKKMNWQKRFAVLAHEALHGTGSGHVNCELGVGSCDLAFNGAYGFESVVVTMMLYGDWQVYKQNQTGFFTEAELLSLGRFLCNRISHVIYEGDVLQSQRPHICEQMTRDEFVKGTHHFARPLYIDEPIPPTPTPDPTDVLGGTP